ncbi:plasmid pRiA4b ORF-3 family protein [Glycomyces niveus]|uniref:plasmid pRiA4b ORF-3 family protein n=1 Tax=Glycomyces niveus TaxID=2820287 RepID=UPI0038CBFCC9
MADAADAELGFTSETETTIGQVLADGNEITCLYDFGDGWDHRVKLEDTATAEEHRAYPYCVDGTGACPPEDCGGPPDTPTSRPPSRGRRATGGPTCSNGWSSSDPPTSTRRPSTATWRTSGCAPCEPWRVDRSTSTTSLRGYRRVKLKLLTMSMARCYPSHSLFPLLKTKEPPCPRREASRRRRPGSRPLGRSTRPRQREEPSTAAAAPGGEGDAPPDPGTHDPGA